MARFVLLQMHGNGHKALSNALRELLVAYLHDILHIEYLYAEKPEKTKSHHYGEYPDCMFLHIFLEACWDAGWKSCLVYGGIWKYRTCNVLQR